VTVTTLTLYGKPGCHLCDVAGEIVGNVTEDFPEAAVEVAEINILDDADLAERYGDKIPVLFIDDDLHAFWRIDASRLRSAIASRQPVAK